MSTKKRTKKKRRTNGKISHEKAVPSLRDLLGNPQALAASITRNVEKARHLVLAICPKALLAEQFLRWTMTIYGKGKESEMPFESQIAARILEFMFSTYASFFPSELEEEHDAEQCGALWNILAEVYQKIQRYELIATDKNGQTFAGGNAGEVEFWARANWTSIRRSRYANHDLPFYRITLGPHADLLRQAYGIDLADILSGVAAIHDALHTGPLPHLAAIADSALPTEVKRPNDLATHTLLDWLSGLASLRVSPDLQEHISALRTADYLNVTKITGWPQSLIDDLSYHRGEVTHYFDGGPKSGWLTKTLPMRRKPFLRIAGNAYAFDTTFALESIYRAIQFGVQERVAGAKTRWSDAQSEMAETIFQEIFSKQIKGANVLRSVRYKPTGGGGNWAECDCVVTLDDTLIIIEAKAGLLGFSAPDEELAQMLERLKRLTLDAYSQADRFLQYLANRDPAPLYVLVNGKYEQTAALALTKFRTVIPMAITVENLAPFGGLLKLLPETQPLLGKHPFLIFSIDDLLPFSELLQDGGSMMHFFEVRQAIARRKDLKIHDEMDHLGAYISQNRADTIGQDQKKADLVIYTGGSDQIDQYYFDLLNEKFGGEPANNAPTQAIPSHVSALLGLLELQRPNSWLEANSRIRNLDGSSRMRVDAKLGQAITGAKAARATLFHLPRLVGLSFSVDLPNQRYSDKQLADKCEAAAIAFRLERWILIALIVGADGELESARVYVSKGAAVSDQIQKDAHTLRSRINATVDEHLQVHITGRNQFCPCGSGLKFKLCHGR